MRMRTLGGTGIKVSPYCLGAMMFGAWGNPDHDESIRIIHRALDAGINFVDTAECYGDGLSESLIGCADPITAAERATDMLSAAHHASSGLRTSMITAPAACRSAPRPACSRTVNGGCGSAPSRASRASGSRWWSWSVSSGLVCLDSSRASSGWCCR